MKSASVVLGIAATLLFAVSATWADPYVIPRPEGALKSVPSQGPDSCDVLLRYDDGTDDWENSGVIVGYASPTIYQFLGVRFTPPPGADYEVAGASFFSEFWVRAGLIEIHAWQVDDPSNSTAASLFVDTGGTWSVDFDTPICIPDGKEYVIMLCTSPDGGMGVTGEDTASPDGRSSWSDSQGCIPANSIPNMDLMIWSCVRKCSTVPAVERSWGGLKSTYR